MSRDRVRVHVAALLVALQGLLVGGQRASGVTGPARQPSSYVMRLTGALVFAQVGALDALDVHHLVQVVLRDAVLPTG